jgi:hypothetical protein
MTKIKYQRKCIMARYSIKKRGGSAGSAHAFGECVYGANPHSVPAVAGGNENNAIAMNSKCGQYGGRRKSRRVRKSKLGGTIFGDIAIPAAFLYANTVYKPRRNSRHRYSRRSRR